ncbi:MAG TPA: DUF4148 domain-containing protein [Albitalea sp.]|uniref:DUF4148 domain-containing protein n=1 Tax=Piscinibacter sp. TaxID=1903157 RepID=UPI002ED44A87
MNSRQLILVPVLALVGGASIAMEATEFPIEPSVLTREAVKSALAQARADGEIVRGEASLRADPPFVAVRTREEVRAEAVAAAHAHRVDPLHTGG